MCDLGMLCRTEDTQSLLVLQKNVLKFSKQSLEMQSNITGREWQSSLEP